MTDEPGTMPTEQEMRQGADVVTAGTEAAAAEPDAKKRRGVAARAIKQEAESKGWELTPEQANMLAGMVVAQLADKLDELPGKTTEHIRQAGGFDHLPEPLTHGPATGAGTLPAEPPAPSPADARDAAPGRERSHGPTAFARWFRSS